MLTPLRKDGETRMFKGRTGLRVIAERVDSETPYVHVCKGEQTLLTLEDVTASELIELLKKALSILPTSK